MKTPSKHNNRDYYPDTSRDFNTSTRSMAQKRHNLSSSKVSDTKSRFQHRIEKACPTNSFDAYKKENQLLKKQLQRLEKQMLKKDQRIFQMESTYTMFRQLESELQETYRVIYMYEGKIQELEKQLKRLQHKIADHLETPLTAEDIESLLNEYRQDNTELKTTLQGQNRVIMEMEEKLKTIQSKYFQTSWKLSSQNRVIANPLKKRFPKLRDTIVIQEMSLGERERMMNQLESRYQQGMNGGSNDKENAKGNDNSRKLMGGSGRFSKDTHKTTMNGSNNNNNQPNINHRHQQSQQQPIHDIRLTPVYETPRPGRMSNTPYNQSKPQSPSENYTMQKVQSTPKVYGNDYRQDWQSGKQGAGNYQVYRVNNETRKSQLTSESQPLSLNYSSSQGSNFMSQRSSSPQQQNQQQQQNGVRTYTLSGSQAVGSSYGTSGNYQTNNNSSTSQLGYTTYGQNINTTQPHRILSPSNNTVTYSQNYPSQAKQTTSMSPSSRIVRVSQNNNKIEPSYSNSQTNQLSQQQAYYEGSGDVMKQGNNRKIRYIMKSS